MKYILQYLILEIKSLNHHLLYFNKMLILLCVSLIFTISVFSKEDTSCISPVFRDSILNNKVDSAQWSVITSQMDIKKSTHKNTIIQKQKSADNNITFLYISGIVLMFLLLMRLLFDDFSFSLLEGIWSFKKYLLYYQTKKYDSLIAIIIVYLISIFVLSLITYIGLVHFVNNDFTMFNIPMFLKILISLILFFSIKNLIEFIFNWVIDTQHIFRAFFLQNLFAELLLSVVVLFLFLIYIYNNGVSYDFILVVFSLIMVLYLVFNIIRSYQLMDNLRISYKLHFFMYICAFKIIPLLLLAKYILNNVVV